MALKKPCFSFSLAGSGGFMTIASAVVLRGKCKEHCFRCMTRVYITSLGLNGDFLSSMSHMRYNLNIGCKYNKYTVWQDTVAKIIPLGKNYRKINKLKIQKTAQRIFSFFNKIVDSVKNKLNNVLVFCSLHLDLPFIMTIFTVSTVHKLLLFPLSTQERKDFVCFQLH